VTQVTLTVDARRRIMLAMSTRAITISWEPTDLLPDGSDVRFITDDPPATPGYTIVENENGDLFQVESSDLTRILP
jgi:hypothetical protein